MTENDNSVDALARRWQPLSAIDRRVVGVLAEKAKTTPDAYPMSLNAVCTGCNQKSNREPVMQLEPADVEESLDRLRELGAAGIVEGYGRVAKYRHYLYDWLGVEKVELSVMTELLLRGDQTEGELRARASRMDPIPDLSALRTILNGLTAKELVVSLTSEGRGHVVTHNLYKPREMEVLRAKYSGAASVPAAADRSAAPLEMPKSTAASSESLHRDLEELRGQVDRLRSELELLSAMHNRTAEEVRRLKEALGA
jgi:uncharacterized protein YceH (UPF0502 family)